MECHFSLFMDNAMHLSPIKIAVIGGVRPHFIKIAALQSSIKIFNQNHQGTLIDAIYINSGQQYDVGLLQYISELGVRFDFTISHSSRDPVHILGSMIIEIYEILKTIDQLKWVLIIGDTSTSFAGTIAATRLGIPVVHIEAGIRSYDLTVIEEIHRRSIDHISTVLFCLNKSGVENLAREGINKNVFWTGDLSYDFFMEYSGKHPPTIFGLPDQGYILVTLHKSSNYKSEDVLKNVIKALEEFAKKSRIVVFVTHPKNRSMLEELGLIHSKNIVFFEPLSFGNMISAIKGCKFLLTDSGGLQKEAYYLGKRCLIRRETIGWTDFIESGVHKLTGTDHNDILNDLIDFENLVETQKNIQDVNGFIREEACNYALRTLLELTDTMQSTKMC